MDVVFSRHVPASTICYEFASSEERSLAFGNSKHCRPIRSRRGLPWDAPRVFKPDIDRHVFQGMTVTCIKCFYSNLLLGKCCGRREQGQCKDNSAERHTSFIVGLRTNR